VGGSVRDELLGLPIKDRDFVVVGATPEEMTRLGYRPVGKDFPVFLHPKTHEEYALARTERKIAKGYKGFQVHATPNVTLEEDLSRRDLTINAIAKDENGNFIDPFNGKADLKAGYLRHVSPAFSEDPVRILRVARFAARFNFQIIPETQTLMENMVCSGEVDALIAERVWQEMATGLMESTPSRMFDVLRACGALARVMPEVDRLFGVPQPTASHPEIDTGIHVMMVIDYTAAKKYSLAVRFPALTHDLGKGTTPAEEWPRHIGHEARSVALTKVLCQRIRVPKEISALAQLVAKFHGTVHRAQELKASTLADLLQSVDAYRKPKRFEEFLQACTSDSHGRTGYADQPYPQFDHMMQALTAANSIDAGKIAAQLAEECTDKAQLSNTIKEKVRAARISAIKYQLK